MENVKGKTMDVSIPSKSGNPVDLAEETVDELRALESQSLPNQGTRSTLQHSECYSSGSCCLNPFQIREPGRPLKRLPRC